MSSNFHPDGTLFIVSGPSGAGKTTLINEARRQLEPIGITLYFSVSHTTRNPRSGEVEVIGRDRAVIGAYTPPGARYSLLAWIPAGCPFPKNCLIQITNTATLSARNRRSSNPAFNNSSSSS